MGWAAGRGRSEAAGFPSDARGGGRAPATTARRAVPPDDRARVRSRARAGLGGARCRWIGLGVAAGRAGQEVVGRVASAPSSAEPGAAEGGVEGAQLVGQQRGGQERPAERREERDELVGVAVGWVLGQRDLLAHLEERQEHRARNAGDGLVQRHRRHRAARRPACRPRTIRPTASPTPLHACHMTGLIASVTGSSSSGSSGTTATGGASWAVAPVGVPLRTQDQQRPAASRRPVGGRASASSPRFEAHLEAHDGLDEHVGLVDRVGEPGAGSVK